MSRNSPIQRSKANIGELESIQESPYSIEKLQISEKPLSKKPDYGGFSPHSKEFRATLDEESMNSNQNNGPSIQEFGKIEINMKDYDLKRIEEKGQKSARRNGLEKVGLGNKRLINGKGRHRQTRSMAIGGTNKDGGIRFMDP